MKDIADRGSVCSNALLGTHSNAWPPAQYVQ
jgi:hypothetical protein